MPASKNHRRHHSWPPLHVHVFKQHKEIDENPFAFFVSPPEDSEREIADDLSAGIEDGRRPRSLSPLHIKERPVSSLRPIPLSPRAVLMRWIEKMEKRYVHKRRASDEELPSPSPPIPAQSPTAPTAPLSPQPRGRATRQHSPNSSSPRQMRSHSGRPRIWRSPPSGIWTLAEEKEQEDKEQEKKEQKDCGLGISF